jgi:M6 family metalloprotease-like protein
MTFMKIRTELLCKYFEDRKTMPIFFRCIMAVVISSALIINSEAAQDESDVTGGPQGAYPYTIKGLSKSQLVETARDHQWSINFDKKSTPDTINIIALRVQFKKDVSSLTTGDGRFFTLDNLRNGDLDEYNDYTAKPDTIYKFDKLPHDSLYFSNQLEMVKSYYKKVSRGKLILTSSIFPSNNTSDKAAGYEVPLPLTSYSPGGKKNKESYDEYYERQTIGLIKFVKEAIITADTSKQTTSPFANITFNSSDNTFRDASGRKTIFLIFHAGASYLTDADEDTPSDFIDAFITKDFFKAYQDSLGIEDDGIAVRKDSLLISEIMMCSETSNQDGLNWGIQGILVNQIARQLGIPDLYSTPSGTSAIGAFCIMDFAGYSAGNGFIPPYPSAWVRAFMGWDDIKIASLGDKANYSVKALTSVLDRDSSVSSTTANDTTILLVPINDHEYYLIENRQRNLSGNPDLFKYDSVDKNKFIAEYPNNLNIEKNVIATTSSVIQKVKNNDISLPASGVLIWHIDEQVIKNRLSYDYVNADSLYRGISLVEADGVNDLGITFSNAYYSAIYDYGGSEDVFPHQTRIESDSSIIDSIGPYTKPSTRSNDGGHTYLNLSIKSQSAKPGKELYYSAKNDGDHYITNFSDSVFSVHLSWDYLIPSWPKQAIPEQFFEPLLADLDVNHKGKELFLLSKSGRAYSWASDSAVNSYNKKRSIIDRSDLNGNVIPSADTILFLDSIATPVGMPSAISNIVYIPSSNGNIYLLRRVSDVDAAQFESITLASKPSTYVCNYHDSSWAIGSQDGRVIFGQGIDTVPSMKLSSDSAVTALASIQELNAVAVIQNDGTLSICSPLKSKPDSSIVITTGIGPYSIVTGDIDKDGASELIISDSRHGLWVFNRDLSLAFGWGKEPNDICNIYSYTADSVDREKNRHLFPVNTAAPALADINRDGHLDIVIGGSNGIYAINYKGVLVYNWPAYLDKKYWYQRGSVSSTPIIVTGKSKEPLVLFSSSTGENATYTINQIIRADKNRGTIWFEKDDGSIDSLSDLTASYIDTLLTLGDSLATPYVLPGGFIDAVNGKAKRPSSVIMETYQSSWPLTTGSSLVTSPMAGFTSTNSSPDLFAVSKEGWVYRWILPKDILPDSLFWAQSGYDAGRSFAYGGSTLSNLVTEKDPITLFSYPNPAIIEKKNDQVIFRYKFSAPASKVRLDIFTYTGFRIYSKTSMGNPPNELTGSFPDWNELVVYVKDFGPAVYRCRMEATINGKSQVKYWKMAVIK